MTVNAPRCTRHRSKAGLYYIASMCPHCQGERRPEVAPCPTHGLPRDGDYLMACAACAAELRAEKEAAKAAAEERRRFLSHPSRDNFDRSNVR